MKVLNPKFALATVFMLFFVWLAMTGQLSEFIDIARRDRK